jgi:hypothetical protein
VDPSAPRSHAAIVGPVAATSPVTVPTRPTTDHRDASPACSASAVW